MPMIFVALVRRGVSMSLATPKSVSRGGVGAAGAEGSLHVEQEDVLRLDVPVDDSGVVRGGQPVGDVGDDRDGGLGGEARSRSRRVRRSVPRG
ncbi:hypothetical protein SVIOM74S_10329 [Streptomyces violarus]